MSNLYFTNGVRQKLTETVADIKPDKAMVLTDNNVAPLIGEDISGLDAPMLVMKAGEENKNLDTLRDVWLSMTEGGLTRKSLLICIGGGVVTDLGGFAASTFKRGIRTVNVPTTLLAAVDASVGGKTGIDFAGLKNEIGAFHEPEAVIISTKYFNTLPKTELLSGEAEMLKHAVIEGREDVAEIIGNPVERLDNESLLMLLRKSVEIKRRIVAADPKESGLRKVLNLGHTAGHALEELAAERGWPMPHGIAVANGLAIALILSRMLAGLDSQWMHMMVKHIAERYPHIPVKCTDYDRMLELMRHDKKNDAAYSALNFSLVEAPGKVIYNCPVKPDDVRSAFDIYRDFIGN